MVVSHIVLAVKENQFSLRLVIGMTSKSGGKNGKHCPVTDTSKISAIANMSLQVFQHRFGCQFRATTDATMSVQSCHFQLLPKGGPDRCSVTHGWRGGVQAGGLKNFFYF